MASLVLNSLQDDFRVELPELKVGNKPTDRTIAAVLEPALVFLHEYQKEKNNELLESKIRQLKANTLDMVEFIASLNNTEEVHQEISEMIVNYKAGL